jgi:Tfp pilus assembly protein PilF
VSRRRGLSFALLAVLALSSGCASSQTTEVEKLRARAAHERGLAALADRNRGEALVALREAVAFDPTAAAYHDSFGLILLDLGQVEAATEEFRKALDLDAKLADTHFHLGTALAEARRWEEAIKSYRAALALPTLTVPDFTHQNLGLALYHLKRYGEAEQALRFALSLDPEMQAAYYNLGLVLVAEDRKEEAKAAFRQARKLGPESALGQAAKERLKDLGEES